MIRGILFDMDGTLLDSMYVWDDCAAMYLRRRGIEPPDDLNAQLATLSFSEGIAWLHDHYFPQESLEEIDRGVYLVIRDEYLYKAVLKPGRPRHWQVCTRWASPWPSRPPMILI